MSPYIIPGLKFREFKTKGNNTFKEIISLVLNNTGKTEKELRAKGRTREIVELRMVCMWAMRKTGATCKSIGNYFNRDHTTVVHADQTINMFIETKNSTVLNIVERVKMFL